MTNRNWYITFGAILTAIGTFLVTTDPIFHYGNLFSAGPKIDSTKVVIKNIPRVELDSIAFSIETHPTLSSLSRKVKKHDVIIDSLKKEIKDIRGN